MESHAQIVEMMRSTGMRRFLDQLHSEEDRAQFETEGADSLKLAYPEQANGRVLFPFRRLFVVAYT